ncbi:type II secretion system F family protein [Hyphococcus luteus]|uniref:Secretion system protein n=1 Tax=Hyphococcus luteus TaxID=2058213 RepID=A0A2S7K5V4_9PROT|nr:type II secretion system F family protein [Marinicaulis flavus]PQA87883.1 secretion system protein [Marinicaulis flavus]
MTSVSAALTLLLIGSAALVAAYLEGRSVRLMLDRRINLVRPLTVAADREDGAGAFLGRMDAALCALFSFGLKRGWKPRTNGLVLLATAAGAMAATWAIASLILGFPGWLGAALGVLAFMIAPRQQLRIVQEKVERQFIEVFPDAVEMIVRMLRAGLPVTTAIRSVAREAAYPVDEVFTGLADQMDIGVAFEDALRKTAESIGLRDFRYFSVAASLQRTTGGNLATTLESLSETIRKKRAMRLRAKAVTAEVRMTAYILGAMPFFIVGALLLTQPDYLAPLVTDPRGNIIAAAALVLLVLAFVIIRSMMRTVTRPS